MPGQFITNQDILLNDVINKILPHSEKLKFLVGYFYFSGIMGIYENLEDKNIKILVGMEVEKGLGKKIKQFHIIEQQQTNPEDIPSNSIIRERYYKSLTALINDTDYFDNEKQVDIIFVIYDCDTFLYLNS